MSEHNVAQLGQTERKPSQVDVAFEVMAKEVAAIHVVVDQLTIKLEPVRIHEEPSGVDPETSPCPLRSPVVARLNELAEALSGQRERLEQLSEEIQL